jgi:hypothetical protein
MFKSHEPRVRGECRVTKWSVPMGGNEDIELLHQRGQKHRDVACDAPKLSQRRDHEETGSPLPHVAVLNVHV